MDQNHFLRKGQAAYVLVDDDEEERNQLRLALERESVPLPIYEVGNGLELLDFLSLMPQNGPGIVRLLVVMDIQMPVLDGLQTVRKLRQHALWEYISVLLISDCAHPDTVERAIDSGACGYMLKATTVEGYKGRLANFLPALFDETLSRPFA